MMKNFNLENVDCHAAHGMIEKRCGFPRRTLRALLGMTKSGQSGRSMIEMLGVLAIIGVLSVGGIAGYSKAMMKYRINKTIEQVTLIAGNVRSFFAPQKNYIGVGCSGYDCDATNGCSGYNGLDDDGNHFSTANGCPIIKKAKILPDEMITVNADGKITAITNPFGGVLSLVDGSSTGMRNQSFSINISGIPQEACVELATQNWNNADVKIIAPNYSYTATPMDITDAVQSCSDNASITLFIGDIDVQTFLANQ